MSLVFRYSDRLSSSPEMESLCYKTNALFMRSYPLSSSPETVVCIALRQGEIDHSPILAGAHYLAPCGGTKVLSSTPTLDDLRPIFKRVAFTSLDLFLHSPDYVVSCYITRFVRFPHDRLRRRYETMSEISKFLRRSAANAMERGDCRTLMVVVVIAALGSTCWAVIDEPTDDGPRQCVICYDEEDEGFVETSCGHEFHGDCIARWLEKSSKGTCPLCRRALLID